MDMMKSLAVVVFLGVVYPISGPAQTTADRDAMIGALQDGNAYLREMITKSAADLADADYDFRPTADVRSLRELFMHIATTNYFFCAAARGERPPAITIEISSAAKDDVQKQLANSFAYCDSAYNNPGTLSQNTVELMGKQRTPATILTFRNYHGLLHYGNVITYIRLRGKVPPSSQTAEMN